MRSNVLRAVTLSIVCRSCPILIRKSVRPAPHLRLNVSSPPRRFACLAVAGTRPISRRTAKRSAIWSDPRAVARRSPQRPPRPRLSQRLRRRAQRRHLRLRPNRRRPRTPQRFARRLSAKRSVGVTLLTTCASYQGRLRQRRFARAGAAPQNIRLAGAFCAGRPLAWSLRCVPTFAAWSMRR